MASTNRTAKTSADVEAAAAPANPLVAADPSTEEQIRVAAYFIYVNNGCRQGHDLDDWVAAQAQLSGVAPGNGGSPEATPNV